MCAGEPGNEARVYDIIVSSSAPPCSDADDDESEQRRLQEAVFDPTLLPHLSH